MTKQTTFYTETFGSYQGPFTFSPEWNYDEDQFSWLGPVFFLLFDDESPLPAFKSARNHNLTWGSRDTAENDWCFLDLVNIIPAAVSNQSELDMLKMLYPECADAFSIEQTPPTPQGAVI